jgi:O-antigen/teichoic acid export membrane protein
MDTQIIAFIAIMVGALCGVIIPYLLKAHKEDIAFDRSYIYAMVISLLLAAFSISPDTIEIAFKPLFALFLAGAGLQVVANKVNTMRIKKADK